ncbi:MAG TPA: transcriptional regulator [Candidatus Marinimicrobia bacterium]|nr:transcriptional regulator [Candidatus Neomarinimicrobiota bacterium]
MNSNLDEIKKRFKNNEDACQKVVDIFALISNKTRFRILCLLTEGDFCVGDIVDTIQISNFSNISQQLRLLSMAGIVESRRDGKRIIYHLKDQRVRDVISYLHEKFLKR